MKSMNFFMHMQPPEITHQQKRAGIRNGKVFFYENAKLADARAKLAAHLSGHVPVVKFDGPLQCVVKWCFPICGDHCHGEWRDTKPDTHNLNKLLFDVMTDLGFWVDDARVASEVIQKFWSDTPGIFVEITRL